ncbi:MAG: hypothetical protein OEW75_03335 [Cyclobacteriaceae bacterium]|nr:hypothetical protein [Cyclobacteriaceae bacterium]
MISTDVLRMGKKYRLFNYGETYEFEIIAFVGEGDYLLKDLHTLETYNFQDLVKFGKSKDYLLEDYYS